jgi:flagellin-like protein
MRLKELLTDDDAVSPVIGVILMVAITVILAAVIASFVLGLGDQNNPAPTADFTFDYNATSDANNDGYLTVTLNQGDQINNDNLYIRGSGLNDTGKWGGSSGVGSGDTGEISAGQSAILDVNSNYDINVVWEDPDSDSTSTLSTDEGPDA